MPISVRFLSVAWIVGACLSAAGIGGYLIYDFVNPTGSQWLLDSGYIFNPPKLTNHESKDNDCSENLFKQDPDLDGNKIYACRSVGINIWNDGDQLSNQSVDYVTWIEKLAIRKGAEGWQIISIINSREGLVRYIQMTTYKYKNNKWQQEWVKLASDGLAKANPTTGSISCEGAQNKNQIQKILSKNKFLKFLSNGDLWYKGTGPPSKTNSVTTPNGTLSEVFKSGKSKSWIWIGGEKRGPKLLDGFSFFDRSTDMSQLYRLIGCTQTYFSGDQELKLQASTDIHQEYEKIKSWTEKGKWISTGEFCKPGYERNINQNKFNDLKTLCAKPKG